MTAHAGEPLPTLCLFDLGDVAARFVPERRLPALAQRLGATAADVTRRIWESGLSARFDRGEFPGDTMAAELGARFGCEVAFAELVELWCRAFEPDPAVLALADRVAERTAVGLFTNNPPALEAGLAAHHPALLRFEPRLFSCSLGVAKPEPAAFREVEARTGLRGSALALIDDSRANVEAASAHGWSALRFEGAESLGGELARRGWI